MASVDTERDDGDMIIVDTVKGKHGKMLPVIDSFLFYPKDKERVRFTCKTRGCNASISIAKTADGWFCVSGKPRHDHPDHADAIKSLVHLQRIRDELAIANNAYVPTRTIVSAVRTETRTCWWILSHLVFLMDVD